MTADSLNPLPGYLLGSPGRDTFSEALAMCHASVVIQCSKDHPLHERIMQEAEAGRERRRLERQSWREILIQRRAARRTA